MSPLNPIYAEETEKRKPPEVVFQGSFTVTFFGPKEVSWIPLLVTVTFFAPKEASWDPVLVT